MGTTTWAKHRIDTIDEIPVRRKPYNLSQPERKKLDEHITEMLKDKVIIAAGNSDWAAPAFLVPKKDGSTRLVCDYRELNRKTLKDKYSLPKIEEILSILGPHPEYISTLDLKSGFWQIQMDEDSVNKTTITTPNGTYSFKKMPFGLTNAPATFQKLMDRVLKDGHRYGVFVYIDDIIIATQTFQEHLTALAYVFQQLRASGLTVKLSKCSFVVEEAKILGHIVSRDGIRIDPEKTAAILDFPRPKNVKNIHQFLGLVGWHQRFILHFAEKTAPLNLLKKKGQKWFWGPAQEHAFRTLKQAIVDTTNLVAPSPEGHFVLQTDASDIGLGAILSQEQEDRGLVPIAYASRLLNKAEKNYSTTEKECLAVVWGVYKFRPYVEGRAFTIVTDHGALTWLNNLKDKRSRLARWALKLQEFQHTIVHRPGKSLSAVDALSRNPSPRFSVLAQIPVQTVLQEVKILEEQAKDLWCRDIIRGLEEQEDSTNSLYEVREDGLLLRKALGYNQAKPVLPSSCRQEVLDTLHKHPLSAHRGRETTYLKVKSRYYWPGMYKDVRDYVSKCHECQVYKAINTKKSGRMGSTVTHTPLEVISIDIMGVLPITARRNRFLVVIVDNFTKWVELYPITTATAKNVSLCLFDYITRWGTPAQIVSDNGTQFTSKLWEETCKFLRIDRKFTTRYHPSPNLTERVNREVKTAISIYIGNRHREWDLPLPFIRFAINTAVHHSTGYSPYYLMCGREPVSPWDAPRAPSDINAYQRDIDLAKDSMDKARERQARYYNEKVQDKEFEVGDLVWRKTFPQSNAALAFAAKLAPKYDGPYKVSRKLNNLNYELLDLRTNESDGIWHIDKLKRGYLEEQENEVPEFSLSDSEEEPDNPPDASIDGIPDASLENGNSEVETVEVPVVGSIDPQDNTRVQREGQIDECATTLPKDRKELLLEPMKHGWLREVVHRKDGVKIDIYYWPPQIWEKRYLRSYRDVKQYLDQNPQCTLTLDCFSFQPEAVGGPPGEIIRPAR